MKTPRQLPSFTVSKKSERKLKAGHPWVYDNEILSAPENAETESL